MDNNVTTHALTENYLRLRPDSSVEVLGGGEEFWGELMAGKLGDFRNEYLVTILTFTEDWSSWENHVNGDEVVLLLAGSVEFFLELPGGVTSVVIDEPGRYVLVPRNTWHTAKTSVETRMLFITAGEGTQVRAI